LFRFVVPVTLGLALVLAFLTSPLLRPHPTRWHEFLQFNLWSLGLVSLTFLLYLRFFKKASLASNVPYLVYGMALALAAFGFSVRDFSLVEDNTAFVLGTLALGMILSAPYWFYLCVNVVGFVTLLIGVGILRPEWLTPDRIGLWLVLNAIGVMTSCVLETRRRESYHGDLLLKEANASLKEISFRDGLTGAYNRRFFEEVFEQQVGMANRKGRSFSLILFDLDKFKSINDDYGHLVGDEVLKNTVTLVQESLRSSDTLNRYGGEEFVVLLADTSLEMAVLVAERIRGNRASTPVVGVEHPVTMSLGVVQHREGETPQTLLQRADTLLYRAKGAGRNQTAW